MVELLKIKCAKFMDSNIPDTMRYYFEGWDELFIKNDGQEKEKRELLLEAKKIPDFVN